MKTYMHWLCVLLLSYQTPTKCTETSETSLELTYEDEELDTLGLHKAEKRQSTSPRKRKRQYLDYANMRPHKKELTPELKALISEKEDILKPKSEHKWEDIYKYPLESHKKFWDDTCVSLWTGPDPRALGFTGTARTVCVATLFPINGGGAKKGTYFRGFRHGYDPVAHRNEWPFMADFICCDCKYIPRDNSNRTIQGSRTYFFAMNINKGEYFLLTRVEKVKEKTPAQIGCMLKIVDYVNVQEKGIAYCSI